MPVRHRRRVPLAHAYNVRDLGGYTASDGRVTAWNRLYRGDGLSGLDGADWERLKDIGVRTVIDLRSTRETAASPDRVPEDMLYLHCPLQREELDPEHLAKSAADAFAGSLTESYAAMVKQAPALLAVALKAVSCGVAGGGVLFHCSAGKDRTGVLAAVILHLLGVPREEIVADYQVSHTYNKNGVNRVVAEMEGGEKLIPLLNSDAANMEALLDFFKEVGLENYLDRSGFAKEEVIKLRGILLED